MSLRDVAKPDLRGLHERFQAFEDAHQVAAHHARIGAIVSTFHNDEIHALCEASFFTIGDVLDLRRLGLLAPDEGWTGESAREMRRKAAAKNRTVES